MHIVLAGGGSAGHISPALALAAALRRTDPEIGLTFLGTEEGLEARLVPQAGYELAFIPRVPLPRDLTPRLLTVPGRLAEAVRVAAGVISRVDADVVVGMGGYVAMPAYLAARRLRVPVVVHEQNARPGIANRFAARFVTTHVAVSFPGTPLRHAKYLGLPIRREIATLDRAAKRAEARAAFGLDPDRPTLLVTGGSQGAVRLNQAVAGAAASLAEAGIQVLHATGRAHQVAPDRPADASTLPPYVAVPYIERMDLAYAAADLAVTRAGANTVTELAVVGLPAVFVPYPVGNGEQRFNAQPVVDAGGGLLVDDADLTSEWVRKHVVGLITDPGKLAAMAKVAHDLVPADADDRLAELVRTVAADARSTRPRRTVGREGS
ncbi:MAG TPA: undecaprenyldiphospho-muramoylpentapeptide beta-N-acetylglucosaminyltransferase [Actinopolymorphaceae bacterium]